MLEDGWNLCWQKLTGFVPGCRGFGEFGGKSREKGDDLCLEREFGGGEDLCWEGELDGRGRFELGGGILGDLCWGDLEKKDLY